MPLTRLVNTYCCRMRIDVPESAAFRQYGTLNNDPRWRQQRAAIRTDIKRAKYSQYSLRQETLLRSGAMSVIETNHIDLFWGWGLDTKGENVLGTAWMRLRKEVAASAVGTPSAKVAVSKL